ncbi:5-oxoprolinase subunit C family protein [Nocardioides mangrovicus]|uniref:5-oxoprolinase subunit C family protein n=1 Tax=Nocardioides mangrovicus TaxID=2478913 RepID=UPI0018E09821|nr:biotin-dependent carboxyltransferase family protein [Nocardioides mangrovicus]
MPELRVVAAGPQTTVQDRGRPGHAHLGVPRSGALDQGALRQANLLVGNDATAAALECLLGGLRFTVDHAVTVAVTGGLAQVSVAGRAAPWGSAVSVRAHEEVALGPVTVGLRAYVGIAGGIDVAPVLGSRSGDVLSGVGPAPLADADTLPVGPASGRPSAAEIAPPTPGRRELRLRLGPREDWFEPRAIDSLDGATYAVGERSNRIGLRLEGAPIGWRGAEELPSEGMVLGAVQVPPDGQPVLFLHDHPVTGGYPVVGVVEEADLAVCAQLRPGERVRLRIIGS